MTETEQEGIYRIPGTDAVIVGRDPKILDLIDQAERAAMHNLPVIVSGETGTGKDLIARLIHYRGSRKEGKFVPFNSGDMGSGDMIQDALFGHAIGAYTGAVDSREGLIRSADRGTLFLDEIGEMPSAVQADLLRVIEDHIVYRRGEDVGRNVDFRLIAATNKDLRASMSDGTFRSDLYHRLNSINLRVPSLRERKSDITILAEYFLRKTGKENQDLINKVYGNSLANFSDRSLAVLCSLHWPGNIRQLDKVIASLVLHEQVEVEEGILRIEGIGKTRTAGNQDLDVSLERTASITELSGEYWYDKTNVKLISATALSRMKGTKSLDEIGSIASGGVVFTQTIDGDLILYLHTDAVASFFNDQIAAERLGESLIYDNDNEIVRTPHRLYTTNRNREKKDLLISGNTISKRLKDKDVNHLMQTLNYKGNGILHIITTHNSYLYSPFDKKNSLDQELEDHHASVKAWRPSEQAVARQPYKAELPSPPKEMGASGYTA